MKFKTANREWVKNAAIIFLAVLLVLTFFSNTIMNRTLPEVATQMVSNGSITAKVRGTGTVTANGLHEVKATQTREIRAVMVKAGQEVVAGDVLFVMGAGSSEELEAAEDQLRQLQSSYNSTAVSNPGFDMAAYNVKLTDATNKLNSAKAAEAAAKADYEAHPNTGISEAKARLDAATIIRDEYSKEIDDQLLPTKALYDNPAAAQYVNGKDADGNDVYVQISSIIDKLSAGLQQLINARDRISDAANKDLNAITLADSAIEPDITALEAAITALKDAKTALDGTPEKQAVFDEKKTAALNLCLAAVKAQAFFDMGNISTAKLDAAQKQVDTFTAEVESLSAGNVYYQTYQTATDQRIAADASLAAVKSEKDSYDRNQASVGVTLTDLAVQINKQKEKIKELSGEEADQVVANVAGSVQSVLCTSGDTVSKDKVMCTIEVPDMGYTLSFSVSNDQAKRLRTGNTATVSNYYWGSEIKAELTSIVTDPKTPQTNKLLTFDLTGDVTAGSELTLSVGEKSASYDTIIPNSSIRSDTNGSFVLMIVAKNSPLGNRYIAQRVGIEVLAADDSNSAVTAALEYGDYVITTSNAPIKSGDQVRMADS